MADPANPTALPPALVINSRGALTLHFPGSDIQSRMQLDDPHALDLDYTRTMMGFLLFVPDPRHILMVGLGGGSLAKFCHRHLPQAHITVAEINPQVIALRDDFLVPPDGPHFQVVQDDGARHVRRASSVEVLLVDGFDETGMPEGLASQRFFDDCHGALAPGGLLVVNLHMGDVRYSSLLDRLRRSFDGAVLVVEDDEQSNSIVFASRGQPFSRYRPGILRQPAGLEGTASRLLQEAFGQVLAALRRQAA